MEEYTRKVPYFNDFEKKKDLLKFTAIKDYENDVDRRDMNKKKNTEDVQFIMKKRWNMKDILTHRLDINNRTQKDVLSERKTKLKIDITENYNAYEKINPFFIDKIVTKPVVTKNIKEVLNNNYEDDDLKIRLSESINTKSDLYEKRKEMFLMELKEGHKMEDDNELIRIHQGVPLDPAKDYTEAVKNKNKQMTFKNYGFWHPPSNHVFSYPDIKAKGRGGYASEMIKAQIIKNKHENIKNKMNVENILDIYKNKNHDISSNKVFLMKNRFRFIGYTKNSYFVDNYLNEKSDIILRYKGFQKKKL
ncbi:conserved protein, unknown function [Hepatocystis sp. ex Piliocolobus tephrosceles]|nr:conserved protein, unknown function [Hepatocystis sp. ex Piliocolobus tephrosceles]